MRVFVSTVVCGAAVSHWQLAREARECGLEMVETKSFGKYRSINWFACLRVR